MTSREDQIQSLRASLIKEQEAAKNTRSLLVAIDRQIAAQKGSPCETAHHPHTIVICEDDECGCGYEYLVCHVCDQHWPCETKQEHLIARGKPWGKGHYILLEGRKVYEEKKGTR